MGQNILFAAMIAAGVPTKGGPIGCMLEEHVEAHGRLEDMRQALATMDVNGIRAASESYCTLLREHIAKEDNILYPMAETTLNAEALDALNSAMRSQSDSDSKSEEMEQLASRLRRRALSL